MSTNATKAAPAGGQPMIELRKVNKWYGDFHVLKELRKASEIT